jgi:hypothetical protein
MRVACQHHVLDDRVPRRGPRSLEASAAGCRRSARFESTSTTAATEADRSTQWTWRPQRPATCRGHPPEHSRLAWRVRPAPRSGQRPLFAHFNWGRAHCAGDTIF